MAPRIIPPCEKCDNRDHHLDPFCKKTCSQWSVYEEDKKVEEVDKRKEFILSYHMDYLGRFRRKR